MVHTQLEREAIAARAKQIYATSIRAEVETEAKIGKMIIIDIDSGDYEIDPKGIPASQLQRERHPDGDLYGIRIGYRTAEAIGGAMQRVDRLTDDYGNVVRELVS